MARTNFLQNLKQGTARLLDSDVADTDVTNSDVDAVDEVDDADVLESVVEEEADELPEASDGPETGALRLPCAHIKNSITADDLIAPVGKKLVVYLYASPDDNAQITYNLDYIKQLIDAANKLLRLNSVTFIDIRAVTIGALQNIIVLNSLTDVVIQLENDPTTSGSTSDFSRQILAVILSGTGQLESFLPVNSKGVVFGKMYMRSIIQDFLPFAKLNANANPKSQGSHLFINLARILLHELTTHAFNTILDHIVGFTPAPADLYNALTEHSPGRNIHYDANFAIKTPTRTYTKLRSEEVISKQVVVNMVSLLRFAADVKRLRYSNQLLRYTKFRNFQKAPLPDFLRQNNEELKYYELVAQRLCGKIRRIP